MSENDRWTLGCAVGGCVFVASMAVGLLIAEGFAKSPATYIPAYFVAVAASVVLAVAAAAIVRRGFGSRRR